MSLSTEEYRQLAQLAQLYLLENYRLQDRLAISLEDHAFFLKDAKQRGYSYRPQTHTVLAAPSVAPPSKKAAAPPPPPPPAAKEPPHKTVPEPREEPTPPPQTRDAFNDVRDAVKKAFPGFTFLENIPEDSVAVAIRTAWRNKLPPVFIVAAPDESVEGLRLLGNVAEAINSRLGVTAKVLQPADIVRHGGWRQVSSEPHYRLAIGTAKALDVAVLADKPHLVIEPTQTYLQSPEHKKALWQSLCERIPRR